MATKAREKKWTYEEATAIAEKEADRVLATIAGMPKDRGFFVLERIIDRLVEESDDRAEEIEQATNRGAS